MTPDPIPTTNQTAQDAIQLIEQLAKQGEDAAEAAIIQAEPWMGAPVWKQLWEALFDYLFQAILKPLALLGGRVIISTEEYFALRSAVAAQVALDQAKKTGDPNALAKASQDLDKAVAGVVHYIGAARP